MMKATIMMSVWFSIFFFMFLFLSDMRDTTVGIMKRVSMEDTGTLAEDVGERLTGSQDLLVLKDIELLLSPLDDLSLSESPSLTSVLSSEAIFAVVTLLSVVISTWYLDSQQLKLFSIFSSLKISFSTFFIFSVGGTEGNAHEKVEPDDRTEVVIVPEDAVVTVSKIEEDDG